MTDRTLYERWEEQQSHWDDEEFLTSLTTLQRLRYRRLEERVVRTLGQATQEGSWEAPVLLDLGCGHADFHDLLPPAWRYIGLDPSMEQLDHGKVARRGLRVLQGAAERIPLRDACVHTVLLKEVLDHSWDPAKVFSEARRVLVPGGSLVVTITNDRSWFKRLLPWVNRALKERQKDHFHFFGPDDLRTLAIRARFDRVRVETYNHLKMPVFLERATGSLGEVFQRSLLGASDALGRLLLPGMGGGMMLTACKPPGGETSSAPPLEPSVNETSAVASDLLEILVCPSCGSALRSKAEALECTSCRRVFPVKEGIPSLLPESTKGS
jgi:SAM-dependent methyltransferase/uncharacterized protein YbaR (Trm112 family)